MIYICPRSSQLLYLDWFFKYALSEETSSLWIIFDCRLQQMRLLRKWLTPSKNSRSINKSMMRSVSKDRFNRFPFSEILAWIPFQFSPTFSPSWTILVGLFISSQILIVGTLYLRGLHRIANWPFVLDLRTQFVRHGDLTPRPMICVWYSIFWHAYDQGP